MIVSKFKRDYIISDRYKIQHFIKDRLYCENYTAEDLTTSKMVSIAIYNSSKIARDDLDKEGNLREIGFLKMSLMGMPNLVGYGDFSNNLEKFKYIATEFISGESVLDRIERSGGLDEFDAVSIVNELLSIVDNFHSLENPILLNGISASNLMIDMSGDSEKIILKNLINARFFDDDFKCRYIDDVHPCYLSLESFNDVFTVKSDIYNIGSLLYALMSQTPPWYVQLNKEDYFSENSIDRVLDKRSKILNFSSNFDSHLKEVVKKALSEDSDKRFNSAKQFMKALKREFEMSSISSSSSSSSSKEKPILKRNRGNGFDDVAGMEDLKQLFQRKIINILKHKKEYEAEGAKIPNGVLLWGPPRCGKSFIAEKFAEEISASYNTVLPSDLGSGGLMDVGLGKIAEVFNEAEKNQPSVVNFEEFDAVVPKRGSMEASQRGNRVNEFLAQMNNCRDRGIFIVATTNRPDQIDPAARASGRIDYVIYVPHPDFDSRKKLFKLFLKNARVDLGLDYDKIADLTDWYPSMDIKKLCEVASEEVAYQRIELGNTDFRISNELMIQIIKKTPPSVSRSEIEIYLNMKKEFGENNDNSHLKSKPVQKRKIGFSTGSNSEDLVGKSIEIIHPLKKGTKGIVLEKINQNIYKLKLDTEDVGDWERDDFKLI